MKTKKYSRFEGSHSSPSSHSYSKHSIVLLATIVSVNVAFANPQGGTVTAGSATITSSGNTTTIQQSSQQAIIQWNSFNISNGQKTQFVQPNSSSVALNRINPTQGASQIYGQLIANGQVILVNAAGIHFGPSAMVNVGGLIASTSDILDSNFLAGNYILDQPSSYHNASIINQGSIIAANYGLVALIGSNVSNSGYIQAEMGSVVLGSGSKFTLDFNGDQLVNFTVDAASSTAGITNSGSAIADGGKIFMTAQTAQSVLDNVINMSGVAQANTVSQQNGEIILSSNAGVSVSGRLTAKGTTSGNSGGVVQITANEITTSSHAVIDTSGMAGGGNITFAANNISLAGQINAIGSSSSALGGNIQLTSDAIQLTNGVTVDANGMAGGGTINFDSATSSNNSYVNLNCGSAVLANALSSGVGGTIDFNSASTYLSNSVVSAAGTGTGTIGGSINIASNAINIYGSLLNASGDLVGGGVTLSGVPVSGNQTNAAYINLDYFSEIAAAGTGSDSVVGGNINLYANNEDIYGIINATDSNTGAVGGNIGIFGNNLSIQDAIISASADFVGGTVTLGGNPYSTTSSTASSSVNVNSYSYIGAAATGDNGFGGVITVSGNTVTLGGELDVSGNPQPYITYTNSGSNNNSYGNNYGYGGSMGGMNGGMCGGGGGGGSGGRGTPVVNNSGSSGGAIIVTGNNITVQSTGYLNAAGNLFGGEILLGSDPSAAIPATTASVTINAGSLLDAGSYGTTGTGGNNPIGGLIRMYANNTTVNGELNAAAAGGSSQSLGGEVEVFADNTVSLGSHSAIFANAASDGGEVLIGGDLHGAGLDPNAQFTNVAAGSVIQASALTNGIGGEVVVWSDNTTNFSGSITARGGAQGGNGGEVEVSGAQMLNYNGHVDVTAPHGMTGTLLLDPANLTIENSGTSSNGNSVLTVAALENALLTANVTLSTGSTSASAPGDITVSNNVSWNNSNTLTLSSYHNININANISNTAGGSLVLNADNTRTGVGTINFGTNGSVNFSGGGVVSVTYEPISFTTPNFFNNNIHTSRGTSLIYDPLNTINTSLNSAALTSYFIEPNTVVNLAQATMQEPTEVVVPASDSMMVAMANNLEVVTEPNSGVAVRVTDQPSGSKCGEGSSCVSNDFYIE